MATSKTIPIGTKIARLTIISPAESDKWGSRSLCRCECGKEAIVKNSKLRLGHTQSCGCLGLEKIIESRTKHGHNRRGKYTKTYVSWQTMWRRCTNENDKKFKDYGGRGIKVCDRWKDFSNFLADLGNRPAGTTIGRINNDGNYEPENCRWETDRQQAANRRSTRIYTVRGVTACIMELSRHFGVNHDIVYGRLRFGKTLEEAFFG